MKLNKKSSQNNRTPSNIPSPVQAKLIVTVPNNRGKETTSDQVVLKASEIIQNEFPHPQGQRNILTDLNDAEKHIKTTKKKENIILVGHGSVGRTIQKGDEEIETYPTLGLFSPISLAKRLIACELPKNYAGTIILAACNTGLRGENGERSFIEFFGKEMNKAGFKNVKIRANLGKARTVSGYQGKDLIEINPELLKGYNSSNIRKISTKEELETLEDGLLSFTPQNHYLINANNNNFYGHAEYHQGNFFIPGADDDFQYYPGHTNALNRQYSSEDTEDGYELVTDNYKNKPTSTSRELENFPGYTPSHQKPIKKDEFSDWDNIESSEVQEAIKFTAPKKKKGLLSKLKSFW